MMTTLQTSSRDAWEHAVCADCWDALFPIGAVFVVPDSDPDGMLCCYCMMQRCGGVLVRDPPVHPLCRGLYGMHAEALHAP